MIGVIALFIVPTILLFTVGIIIRKKEKLASTILIVMAIIYTVIAMIGIGVCFSMGVS